MAAMAKHVPLLLVLAIPGAHAGLAPVCLSAGDIETPIITNPDFNWGFDNFGTTAFDLDAIIPRACDETFEYDYSIGCLNNDVSRSSACPKGDVVVCDGVTQIPPLAFFNCDLITSVTLPASVTSIGNGSFADMDMLEEFDASEADVTLGQAALAMNGNLTSVRFNSIGQKVPVGCFAFTSSLDPDDFVVNDLSALERIDAVAFLLSFGLGYDYGYNYGCEYGEYGPYGCGGGLNLANSALESIGPFAFVASGVSSVTVPSTLEYIGNYAFAYSDLGDGLDLSNTAVTGIMQATFGRSGIGSIQLPDGLEIINEFAFTEAQRLSGVDFSNTQVTDIRAGAFALSGVGSVVMGDVMEYVGAYSFYYCAMLTSVDFQNSAAEIRDGAFAADVSLAHVDLGAVTSVGAYAFYYDDMYSPIVLPSTLIDFDPTSFARYPADMTACVNLDETCGYYRIEEELLPQERRLSSSCGTQNDDYDFTADIMCCYCGGGYYEPIVPTVRKVVHVEPVPEDRQIAFDNATQDFEASGICDVKAGGDGPCICEYRFEEYPPVLSAITPVRRLTYYEYDGDEGIRPAIGEVKAEICVSAAQCVDGMCVDGSNLVPGCWNPKDAGYDVDEDGELRCELSEVWCPPPGDLHICPDVTRIPPCAFANCTAIEKVFLHDGITEIGLGAFSCSESIDVSRRLVNVEILEEYPEWCGPKEVLFGSGLTHIGKAAFAQAMEFNVLEFPDSLIEIGAEAFKHTNVTHVFVPESSAMEMVGAHAFLDVAIKYFHFPEGLEKIEHGAFEGTMLDDVRLPGNVVAVGGDAFKVRGALYFCASESTAFKECRDTSPEPGDCPISPDECPSRRLDDTATDVRRLRDDLSPSALVEKCCICGGGEIDENVMPYVDAETTVCTCPDECGDDCTEWMSQWGYCGNSHWYKTGGTDCRTCDTSPCPTVCEPENHNTDTGLVCTDFVSQWGYCGSSYWHQLDGTNCHWCRAPRVRCPDECEAIECYEYISAWGYCGNTWWHSNDGIDCTVCEAEEPPPVQ